MNPDTVTFLVGLAMLAIGIIGTDALARRARRAKDDEHAALADAYADACRVIDETATERDAMSKSAERAHRRATRAEAEVEWQKVLHAIALGELDRVTERHATVLTLDGIIADRAQGITYDGAEPPLSVLARTGGEVVPIKGKGGKR